MRRGRFLHQARERCECILSFELLIAILECSPKGCRDITILLVEEQIFVVSRTTLERIGLRHQFA